MMADADENTLIIVDHARYCELGENSMTRTASHTNRLARQQLTLSANGSHYQCIQDTFRTFLTKNQLTAEVPHQLEYLPAVIISGEASKSPLGLCVMQSRRSSATRKTRSEIQLTHCMWKP